MVSTICGHKGCVAGQPCHIWNPAPTTVKEAIDVAIAIFNGDDVSDRNVKRAERILSGADWNRVATLNAWRATYDAKAQRGIED